MENLFIQMMYKWTLMTDLVIQGHIICESHNSVISSTAQNMYYVMEIT